MPCVYDETVSSVEGVRVIWQRSLGVADLPASLHWIRTCKTVWGSDGTVWQGLMCQSACGNMHNVREKKGSSIKVNSKAKKKCIKIPAHYHTYAWHTGPTVLRTGLSIWPTNTFQTCISPRGSTGYGANRNALYCVRWLCVVWGNTPNRWPGCIGDCLP